MHFKEPCFHANLPFVNRYSAQTDNESKLSLYIDIIYQKGYYFLDTKNIIMHIRPLVIMHFSWSILKRRSKKRRFVLIFTLLIFLKWSILKSVIKYKLQKAKSSINKTKPGAGVLYVLYGHSNYLPHHWPLHSKKRTNVRY